MKSILLCVGSALRTISVLFGAFVLSTYCANGGEPPSGASMFSAPIEVRAMPAGAEFVTISTPIDFDALLRGARAAGIVDEHTIRLFRIQADGTETEQP